MSRVGEFDLIARYFKSARQAADVRLGIGDDAALLRTQAGQDLAVAVDTLVSGVHFGADDSPEGIGHKALAVNLSDLAAMGARPAWATLALTLPRVDGRWLAAFAKGFHALAEAHGVVLVGGDTTAGPLCISVQVGGWLPAGQGMRRSGARAGDQLCISGPLGLAAQALQLRQAGQTVPPQWAECLDRPQPRVALGLELLPQATACIDISDGLLADLGHILAASQLGATLQLDRLGAADAPALQAALRGGDDYELCFTLPSELSLPAGCACIGQIDAQPGLRLQQPDGQLETVQPTGYEHFS